MKRLNGAYHTIHMRGFRANRCEGKPIPLFVPCKVLEAGGPATTTFRVPHSCGLIAWVGIREANRSRQNSLVNLRGGVLGGGNFLFGAAGQGVGFFVLGGVVARLLPHLPALGQLLLGLGCVDLAGKHRRLG